MKPILTGSEERACSFLSEDAGMAEACLVSLVDSSIRSEIVRVDQTDETDQKIRQAQFDRGKRGAITMETDKVRYIVDEKGERTAVVLPINDYKELLEDLHDLVVIAERREEPTVPFGELKKKLKKDGLLLDSMETIGGR